MIYIILGALVVLMVYLITKEFQKNKLSSSSTQTNTEFSAEINTKQARVGDAVTIRGAGTDYDDVFFDIDRRNRYESSGMEWYELSGEDKGKRIFLEWYDDDELEITLRTNKKPTLEDLGVAEDDLARMDEEVLRSNFIEYDGKKWNYESSKEVGYFKDEEGEGEGHYCWEFLSEDGKDKLFIEKWEGEPFEAGVAQIINPSDVTVIRK